MVEGRVGEHDAELAVVGRHVRKGHSRRCDDDRRGGAGEQRLVLGRQLGQRPRGGKVPRHERERLFLPELSFPQGGHRRAVPRIAREVIAADSLDGEERAPAEQLRGTRDDAVTLLGPVPCRSR